MYLYNHSMHDWLYGIDTASNMENESFFVDVQEFICKSSRLWLNIKKSWNIFYGHSLRSADSRKAVVSFWRKNVHNTG